MRNFVRNPLAGAVELTNTKTAERPTGSKRGLLFLRNVSHLLPEVATGRTVWHSLAIVLVFAQLLYGQTDRSKLRIDPGLTSTLPGHVSPRVRIAVDQGQAPDSLLLEHVSLFLKRSPSQQADLEELMAQQQGSSSPLYRHWLTPEQYADRFGFSRSDMGAVTDWLEAEGFTDVRASRGRGWVTFSGTARQFKRTFHTSIHLFDFGGEQYYASVTDPSLPVAVQQIALGFQGLTNFRPKPVARIAVPAGQGLATTSLGCDTASGYPESGRLTPANFATIYDISPLYEMNPAIDGSLQKIAVVGEAGVTGTSLLNDVTQFRSCYGLPPTVPTGASTKGSPVVAILGGSQPQSTPSDALSEADLDLEWTGAVAPNAQVIYDYAANIFDAAADVIDNDRAPVLSMSYGSCEPGAAGIDPLLYRALAQQGNVEGITWLADSGDSGPAGCDIHEINPEATNGLAVLLPASIPEVTAVGGTEFAESFSGGNFWNAEGSATGYIPEQVWNDTVLSDTLLASGGGASRIFSTKPVWQLGLGADSARDLPDVSFAASPYHDPYRIFFNGNTSPQSAGGTSAATPSFAGIIALLNQYLMMKTPSGTAGSGNINPGLYALAQAQPQVFHDITVGSNTVPCGAGTPNCPAAMGAPKVLGFSALPGYDQASGLGSLDVSAFIKAWSAGQPSTTSLSAIVPAGGLTVASSLQLSATVVPGSAAASAFPTGSVNFIVTHPSPIFLGSVQLVSTTGTATANLLVEPGQLPVGTDTIEAIYSGDDSFRSSFGTTTATMSASTGNSSVVATVPLVVPEVPVADGGTNWTVTIKLQNLAPFSTVLTSVTALGTSTGTSVSSSITGNFDLNLSGSIVDLFGSATIPASGAVSATYRTNNVVPPETVVFSFSGVDASGYAWNTTCTTLLNGAPTIISNMVSAATFQPVAVPVGSPDPPADAPDVEQSVFAPGMAVSVFGRPGDNLSQFTASAPLPLPSYLVSPDGSSFVQASISGTPTPLYFVAPYQPQLSPPAPSQINLQIPYELQTSFSATATSLPAVLTLNNGGVVTSFSFTVQPVAPSIFLTHGVWNTPATGAVSVNNQANPAPAGSAVTIYFTGAGALKSPGLIDGQAAQVGTPAPLGTVALTLSGDGIDPQTFPNTNAPLTVAMAPGSVGLAQAAFTLPQNLPAGSYKLTISMQGVVGTGMSAVTLPSVTGNTVTLWVGPLLQ